MDDTTAPPKGPPWQPISPRWGAALRGATLTVAVLGLVLAGVLWFFDLPRVALVVAGVIVLACLWRGIVADRVCRAWGYAETADELWIRSGVLVRRQIVLPYGRLQLADVSEGPWLRRYGLADVQVTAAGIGGPSTIKGLDRTDAEALMNRLVERAKTRQWSQ